jgi:agmatinase
MKTRGTGPTFLNLQGDAGDPDKAGVVILPLPYERTSSYVSGCFQGPSAILEASSELEEYDEELAQEIYRSCGGIATLEPMHFLTETAPEAIDRIRRAVLDLLEMGKFVVCLGGEHTCSLGPLRAFHDRYGDGLSVLQLDAHRDLRDSYLGDPYSHASVMARALEFVPSLVQLGIRSHSQEEVRFDAAENVTTCYAQKIRTGEMPGWEKEVLGALSDNVYVTIDSDFFDPSIVPSVGTPEPGGFSWYETIGFLRRLCAEKTVVGFDLCEFTPIEGIHHPDFTLARLVYKLIGYVWLRRASSLPPKAS